LAEGEEVVVEVDLVVTKMLSRLPSFRMIGAMARRMDSIWLEILLERVFSGEVTQKNQPVYLNKYDKFDRPPENFG
jgi:hypothetical protein